MNGTGNDVSGDSYSKIMNDVIKTMRRISVRNMNDDILYKMTHRRRGKAIIFNNEIFHDSRLRKRIGTDVDRSNLDHTLKCLDFEVEINNDLTVQELKQVLDDTSKKNFSDCDCLLIAVLSHGKQNGFISARDKYYSINTLCEKFTADICPTLDGKPKIFIIHACQGELFNTGVEVEPVDEVDSAVQSCYISLQSYCSSLQADFLIACSTIPGFYSWRDLQKGTWFIQALCDELSKYWKEFDLMTILTFVNRRVAFDFESNVPTTPSMHRQKQIPCVTSMLTKLITFLPKNNENNDNCDNITGAEEDKTRSDAVDAHPPGILSQIFQSNRKVFIPNRKKDTHFKMTHQRRGKAIIFNNKLFDESSFKPRLGTDTDSGTLENTLKVLGFQVEEHKDLTTKQLNQVLDERSKEEYSDCDCLLIAVLSYGRGKRLYAKNKYYYINKLYEKFTPDNCPTLTGKPKIFIIQACSYNKEEVEADSGLHSYRIPLHTDFVFAYSNIPGSFSWENNDQKGSWFIQALCDELNRSWTELDLISILTIVSQRVASVLKSEIPNAMQIQIPCITSMLTRLVKFE